MDETLRAELLAMAQRDLDTRRRLIEAGALYGPHLPRDFYHPDMKAVHEQNNAALQAILDAHAWPGFVLVGPDGAEAAWKIAQHAILAPELREQALSLLTTAARSGDASLEHMAMLTDSVLMSRGEPQVYGCIFVGGEDGGLVPWTIADPEHVEERRRSVGLPPLADKLTEMNQHVSLENKVQQETLTTPFVVPTDFNVVRVLFDLPDTSREQVFAYFTQADLLLRWWADEAQTDPQQGGEYHVAWPKLNYHLRGRYVEFEPGQSLKFTWNWDHEPENPERTVSIAFLPHHGGTRLTLEHGVYAEGNEEERQSHIDGWLHYLGKLGEAANK